MLSTYSPTCVRRVVLCRIVDTGRDETQQYDIPMRRRHDEVDEAVGRGGKVATFNHNTKPLILAAYSQAKLNFFVWRWRVVLSRDIQL